MSFILSSLHTDCEHQRTLRDVSCDLGEAKSSRQEEENRWKREMEVRITCDRGEMLATDGATPRRFSCFLWWRKHSVWKKYKRPCQFVNFILRRNIVDAQKDPR